MSSSPLADLRIGAVSYLNTRPLIHALDARKLTLDVPAVLAGKFLDGHLDAALLPLFEILRTGGGRLVDDVGIACRGEVYSVFVAGKGEFSECREIYLDPSSRSSQALLKTLLAEYYPGTHAVVEAGTVPPDAPRLLIGDPAIRFRRENRGGWKFHDLGALWKHHTGLPFVFAVWALGPGAKSEAGETFRELKRQGLGHREEIAAGESDPTFALRYLTEFIRYDVGLEEKAGVALFETLARRHGILPAGAESRLVWC